MRAKLGDRLFAAVYDRLTASSERAGFADLRRTLLQDARGRVLEVGAGTGLNLEHYPDEVAELVLTEPVQPMFERLRERVASTGKNASVVQAPVEALPFPDASFDTVVCTLVLCSVADQQAALEEIRRVLRPGGRLLFVEHVRADDPRLARWQDRLTPLNRVLGRGCHPNRTTLSAIESAFDVEQVEHDRFPKAPPHVRPLIHGRAATRESAAHAG
jgi:ubiquinone/menaquinone biosynthesis C-methylase UbiE